MLRRTTSIPLVKEVPKLSSYREKRAQSKHATTSNADSKGLQQIEETMKSNMKKRGLSQKCYTTSNLLTTQLNEQQTSIQLTEEPSTKIIQKYGNIKNNIAEVNQEDQGISHLQAEKNDQTIKKQPRKKLNIGIKYLDKEASNQISTRNLKTQPSRIEKDVGIARKTLTKVLKPTVAKVEKKAPIKMLHVTQQSRNDGVKFIKKVELLQQQIFKGVSNEKMNHLRHYFDCIIEVLRAPEQ